MVKVSLEDIAEGTGVAIGTVISVGGGMLLAAAGGAALGALTGEICDQLPYLNNAIPDGIAYIGNVFTNGDTVEESARYLQGNLDKFGAAAGFIGGYFGRTFSIKKESG